ncbi:NTP transferase domain-containing protein [Candidatus Woesearchaeota archaeon]|nr:NTP transferase domain-containing protein [Candidatus Woesearchaeota archaeon]
MAVMKAIILAGGFAKRLWPLTKDKPKHLLKVADRYIIDYCMEKISEVPQIDEVILSTNARFAPNFREWMEGLENNKKLTLLEEPALEEGQKFGSIGALKWLLEKTGLDDDVLIYGADNIFEFSLNDLIKVFNQKKASVLGIYDIRSLEEAKKFGCVEVDENDRIIDFLEKPPEPKTTIVSTAVYLFKREDIGLIRRYVEEGHDPDKMGNFVDWLRKEKDVYAFIFGGRWFDIGSFELLEEADKYFRGKARPEAAEPFS